MQKPFKFAPDFAAMLVEMLAHDPDARLLLHDEIRGGAHEVMARHLRREAIRLGVGLRERVHWVPEQPHYRLMALYRLADVVLDSYFAGGLTTTREALEVGAMIVTLPSTYLGSRWTAAIYNIMGFDDLVAKDPHDYVQIAVRAATDAAFAAMLPQYCRSM